MTLRLGLKATTRHRVQDADLATSWGGSVSAFASPVLIGLIEETCMKVTDHLLTQGQITVGTGFEIQHVAPTPRGCEVEIAAELIAIDARRLTYAVSARDPGGDIAKGSHVRGVVDRGVFLDKLEKRAAQIA